MPFIQAKVAVALIAALSTSASPASRTLLPPNVQTVYAIGPCEQYVAQWLGASQGWEVIGGEAQNLYVGQAGVFATDPTSGDIMQYSGTPNSWNVIGGPGNTFAVGSHLWGMAPDGSYVAQWNGAQGWTEIGGPSNMIYAGGFGLFATNPSSSEIYQYNGTTNTWAGIGSATNSLFAVSDTAIYRLDANQEIEQWSGSGSTWNVIDTNKATRIYAGGYGVFATSLATGEIDRYNGTPNSWTMVGGPGTQFAVSDTDVYGLATDDSYVAAYSGQGQSWSEIGGQTYQIAAGG